MRSRISRAIPPTPRSPALVVPGCSLPIARRLPLPVPISCPRNPMSHSPDVATRNPPAPFPGCARLHDPAGDRSRCAPQRTDPPRPSAGLRQELISPRAEEKSLTQPEVRQAPASADTAPPPASVLPAEWPAIQTVSESLPPCGGQISGQTRAGAMHHQFLAPDRSELPRATGAAPTRAGCAQLPASPRLDSTALVPCEYLPEKFPSRRADPAGRTFLTAPRPPPAAEPPGIDGPCIWLQRPDSLPEFGLPHPSRKLPWRAVPSWQSLPGTDCRHGAVRLFPRHISLGNGRLPSTR